MSSCAIMVINGSEEMLDLFQEIFEEFGEGNLLCILRSLWDSHHVSEIRRQKPSLILIDQPFNDTEMNGWELVQRIRLARDLRDIPLVFTTTNVHLLSDLDAQLRSLDVHTLVKPFDPDQLMDLIHRQLRAVGALPAQEDSAAQAGNEKADG